MERDDWFTIGIAIAVFVVFAVFSVATHRYDNGFEDGYNQHDLEVVKEAQNYIEIANEKNVLVSLIEDDKRCYYGGYIEGAKSWFEETQFDTFVNNSTGN